MSEFQKAAALLAGQRIEDLTDPDFDCLQRCASELRNGGLVPRISERVLRSNRHIGTCDIERALNFVTRLAVGPDRSAEIADGAEEARNGRPSAAEIAAALFQQAALISPSL